MQHIFDANESLGGVVVSQNTGRELQIEGRWSEKNKKSVDPRG